MKPKLRFRMCGSALFRTTHALLDESWGHHYNLIALLWPSRMTLERPSFPYIRVGVPR